MFALVFNEKKDGYGLVMNQTVIDLGIPKPLLVDARGAARLSGICRAKWFELQSAGKVPAPIRTLGTRCPRWSVEELRDWVRAGCPDRVQWERVKGACR